MGVKEYETKLALAESTKGSYDAMVDLLRYIRKEKMRTPRVVANFGRILIDKFSWRLGKDLWTVYEQVFVAALDLHDDELAELCLKPLKAKFPSSSRVARLEGMQFEQRGEFAKAEEVYEEILKGNPANALVMKRKIAILKAQKKTPELISALNEFLRGFGTDQAAWMELGETYLSIGAYRYAAFCYEELVLQNPNDSLLHCRLADIYCTLGGLENLRIARKHYSHSITINKQMNMRAYLGLLTCTKSIAAHRNYKANTEDGELNERVQKYAMDFLLQEYTSKAASDLADIAASALKSL